MMGSLQTYGDDPTRFHPHLHSLVPGGGLSSNHARWISSRPHFFLPVKVLSRVLRGKFVDGLQRAFLSNKLSFHGECLPLANEKAFASFLRTLCRQDWVVYAKPPFGGPEHVLQYLARYTHRVAISNHRIVSVNKSQVTFQWKDYAHPNKKRTMTLTCEKFLRRFLQHVLPKGLPRIRYFGWLANRRGGELLPRCRVLLHQVATATLTPPPNEPEVGQCRRCHGAMFMVERLTAAQIRYMEIRKECILDSS